MLNFNAEYGIVEADGLTQSVKVLRQSLSTRGGGVEIDLGGLDPALEGGRMAAYQNYLGGGMLGSIQVNDSLRVSGGAWLDEDTNQKLDEIGESLKRVFYDMMCHYLGDDPSDEGYEGLQKLPASAY